jgi:hypothetical protein
VNAQFPRPRTSAEALDEAAVALLAAVNGRFAALDRRSGTPRKWGLSKVIAAVALALEARRVCEAPAALASAGRAADSVYRLGPAALKTRCSEARALLTHAVSPAWRLSLKAIGPGRLVDEIASALAPLSLQAALKARATMLAGARGGRPVESPVLVEVKSLIAQEREGDPAARAELVALSLHLRHWTDRVLQQALKAG